MSIKLYHGTSERVARLALTEGLRPRSETGSKGNWKHTVDSSLDTIHLTNAYAGYFAASASEGGERWSIIEVEVDESKLFPDEDFLEQASRGNRAAPASIRGQSMEVRTAWFRERLHRFQEHWRNSLDGLGNCAHYGAIKPDCITRISLFSPNRNLLFWRAMDASITLLNYRILGGEYRALTRWFVGYRVRAKDVFGFEWGSMDRQKRKQANAALKDTSCLEFLKM